MRTYLGDIGEEAKKAAESLDGTAESLDAIRVNASEATKPTLDFKNTLKGIGVGLLNSAITAGITAVIQLAIKQLDKYIHRAERAKEASDQLFSDLDSALSKLESHKQVIESLPDDYERLADGVDKFGNNVSLSNEDFAKYQDICNQIANAYPEMVTAWTKEGDAVVNLKNSVNDLTEALKEEREAALNAFVAGADTVVNGYQLNANHSAENMFDSTGYLQQIEILEQVQDVLDSADSLDMRTFRSDSMKLRDLVGVENGNDIIKTLGNIGWDEKLKEYADDIDGLRLYLAATIKNLHSELDSEDESMRQAMLKMFELDSTDAENISNEAYTIGTRYINSLDAGFYAGIDDAGELRRVSRQLVEDLNTIFSDKELGSKAIKLFNEDLTTAEFEQYLTEVQAWCKDHGIEIPFRL